MKKQLLAALLSLAVLLSAFAVCGVAGYAGAASDSLTYTVSYGTTDGKTLSELTVLSDDQLTSYTDNKSFSLQSSTGIPCQVFEVDTSAVTASTITLTVGAATVENERTALKVLNVTTGAWDTVATAVTAGTLKADVALADYAKDGKLQAMVTLDFIANGSNRFIWSTDQQHYTKHDDLNDTYYKIHEHMVEEYQKDNVAYVINTGDIVDDTPNLVNSAKQWIVASKAFKILDDAGVPYGIVTGNHDVGDYPTNNYTRYLQHFAEERYEGKPWFGGTEDDNKCHYDLVTVGNHDFLLLYIGYGQGSDAAVIEWANRVLAMYPHRNAIICTHQYLKPSTLTQEGRATILHNTVVANNPNVKMILSGHYDGAGYKWRDADGRNVLEVVADYQFVQAESEEYYADHADPLHHIGSVAYCNGEGYLREIVINGNTVDMYAYSPVTGGVTPFGARDDLRFTVEFQSTERTITSYGFSASASGDRTVTQTPAEGIRLVCDAPALSTLIDKASSLNTSGYTATSSSSFNTALEAAKKALKEQSNIPEEYTALSTALGALEENVPIMDRTYLQTVLDLNLKLPMWKNTSAPESLDSIESDIAAEQLDNGGFTAQKSAFSPIGWPAMKYVDPIKFTPKDGKVYLYLDVEAGSTWSIYPQVIQNMQMYEGRLNYVVEGSYRNDLDAGSGTYKGVYDITKGLEEMGLDMTKEMTITFCMNVVPGPVTVNAISILTGEYVEPTTTAPAVTAPADGTPGNSNNTVWWIVLGVVVVLCAAAVLFAVLYNPKKKETETKTEAEEQQDKTTEEQQEENTEEQQEESAEE